MASTNVRISSTSHEILRRLAREEKQPMQVILDKAVERYRRARFLNSANADFAALRNNSGAWKEVLAERRLWETTAADGLEDE
jgi:hypothetical protein